MSELCRSSFRNYKRRSSGLMTGLCLIMFLFLVHGIVSPVHAIQEATNVVQVDGFKSSMIYLEAPGTPLVYHSDEEGNRIPDFSYAGYRGGGVELPDLPVRITLDPSSSGNDTEQIKQAIDEVGGMEMDENGHRGAVLLNPGTYYISERIVIGHSGVVLRGSGDDEDPSSNSVIHAAKEIGNVSIQVGTGNADWNIRQGSPLTTITTEFVNVGTRHFELENSNGFEIGDDIILFHSATQEWIEAVDYGGRPLSAPNPWSVGESNLNIEIKRKITGKQGNLIAVDVPVYTHLNRSLSETLVFKPDFSGLVTESGVENFRLVLESDDPEADDHGFHALFFDGVEHSWADGVTVLHFRNTGLGTTRSSFVTIQNSRALEPHSPVTGARRYNFNTSTRSNNILFSNNIASNGRHCFVSNGTAKVSGIVFTGSSSTGATNSSEGHRRWSQGLLFDNLVFSETNRNTLVGLYNRGDWGTRHGWSAVHSVVWNTDVGGGEIVVQKPPTGQNYGVANRGTVTGNGPWEGPTGFIEGTNAPPQFASLYQAQLEDRMEFGIAPDAPSVVEVTLQNDNEESKVSWTHLGLEEVEFVIERSADDGDFEEISRLGSDSSYYIDESLDLEKQTYSYRIAAVDQERKSAWSNVASFEMNLPAFILRNPDSNTNIELTDDPEKNVAFWWNKVDSGRDIFYTWYLDNSEGDFSEPLMHRTSEDELVQIPYSELYQVLKEAEVDSGDVFTGKWTVKASDGLLERWADESFKIELLRQAITTSNSKDDLLIPREIQLHQNYPNPFNPTTQIRYDIPNQAQVRIEVYNTLGRRVATLVNESKSAGQYVTSFDAYGLSSGIYIYRLQAGSFIQTRQMMLIK